MVKTYTRRARINPAWGQGMKNKPRRPKPATVPYSVNERDFYSYADDLKLEGRRPLAADYEAGSDRFLENDNYISKLKASSCAPDFVIINPRTLTSIFCSHYLATNAYAHDGAPSPDRPLYRGVPIRFSGCVEFGALIPGYCSRERAAKADLVKVPTETDPDDEENDND
jgi:hypothetical protein